jgi:hypothetical protein
MSIDDMHRTCLDLPAQGMGHLQAAPRIRQSALKAVHFRHLLDGLS